MRITLTIEPAVAQRLRKLLVSEDRTLEALVNDALREGLEVVENERNGGGFRLSVEPHNFGGLNSGIDPSRIGRFADDLEDEARVDRMRKGLSFLTPTAI